MSGRWAGSDRGRATSSTRWKKFRLTILKRDRHRCTIPDCPTPTDRLNVDHVRNLKSGGTEYDPSNCQTLCFTHHARKSAAEGVAARATRKRPPERHPGLINSSRGGGG